MGDPARQGLLARPDKTALELKDLRGQKDRREIKAHLAHPASLATPQRCSRLRLQQSSRCTPPLPTCKQRSSCAVHWQTQYNASLSLFVP